MSSLPLHPAIVHLPIALALLVPLLGGALWLAWLRGALPRRTWLVAVAAQALLVISGVAALRTGEADEERVEATVPEAALEAHEHAAQRFVGLGALTLGLAVAGAAVRDERLARSLAAGAVVSSLAVLGAGYVVGEAGGALVYQHGAAAAHATAPGTALAHHDD